MGVYDNLVKSVKNLSNNKSYGPIILSTLFFLGTCASVGYLIGSSWTDDDKQIELEDPLLIVDENDEVVKDFNKSWDETKCINPTKTDAIEKSEL